MQTIFQKQKEACLSGVDLSRKGSIDEPIQELVSYINDQEQYVSTSSCSGRIAVFSYPTGGEVKKKGCNWLYITHDMCSREKIVEALSGCEGDAFFKFEAFVLHVQCATLQHAQTILAEAVASGYRNSGISIGKKGKIITAVRSTHSLEVPLTHNGNILVSEQYIDHLAKLGNEKMAENIERIQRFFSNLKSALVKETVSNDSEQSNLKNKHPKHKYSKDRTINNSYEVSNKLKQDPCKDCQKTVNCACVRNGSVDLKVDSTDEDMNLNLFEVE